MIGGIRQRCSHRDCHECSCPHFLMFFCNASVTSIRAVIGIEFVREHIKVQSQVSVCHDPQVNIEYT